MADHCGSRPFRVVITGASAGVGRAVAEEFAAQGWHVGLIARGRAGLEGARAAVERRGAVALTIAADVADAQAVDRAAEEVVAAWGGIDIWINAAMATVLAPSREVTPEEFRRVTEVTYLGQVFGTMAAVRQMSRQGHGTIVSIGSA
ncbi:MAG: SDR family NAD(P)-dependent oxidoreductase, partial [Paracoccus sp. (in: a-proteobacteria)]